MPAEPKLLAQGLSPSLETKEKDSLNRLSVPGTSSTYLEDIRRRAETITPLLKKILDYRPPPHWGINE